MDTNNNNTTLLFIYEHNLCVKNVILCRHPLAAASTLLTTSRRDDVTLFVTSPHRDDDDSLSPPLVAPGVLKMASSFWKSIVGVGLFALAHAAFSAAQRKFDGRRCDVGMINYQAAAALLSRVV